MANNHVVPGFDAEKCEFLVVELHRVAHADSCIVMKLKGQLDTYSSAFLQKSAQKVINAGFGCLILSLGDVDHVSSKAVGSFIQIQKALASFGGEMAIVDARPRIRSVFRSLGLDKILCIRDSLAEAVALVKSRS